MAKHKSIMVTEEMISAGVRAHTDYEVSDGDMTLGEAIKEIFVSMLSAAQSNQLRSQAKRELRLRVAPSSPVS